VPVAAGVAPATPCEWLPYPLIRAADSAAANATTTIRTVVRFMLNGRLLWMWVDSAQGGCLVEFVAVTGGCDRKSSPARNGGRLDDAEEPIQSRVREDVAHPRRQVHELQRMAGAREPLVRVHEHGDAGARDVVEAG